MVTDEPVHSKHHLKWNLFGSMKWAKRSQQQQIMLRTKEIPEQMQIRSAWSLKSVSLEEVKVISEALGLQQTTG